MPNDLKRVQSHLIRQLFENIWITLHSINLHITTQEAFHSVEYFIVCLHCKFPQHNLAGYNTIIQEDTGGMLQYDFVNLLFWTNAVRKFCVLEFFACICREQILIDDLSRVLFTQLNSTGSLFYSTAVWQPGLCELVDSVCSAWGDCWRVGCCLPSEFLSSNQYVGRRWKVKDLQMDKLLFLEPRQADDNYNLSLCPYLWKSADRLMFFWTVATDLPRFFC